VSSLLASVGNYGDFVFIFLFIEHTFFGVLPFGVTFVLLHPSIFREIKASSSSSNSSLESSSEELSTLRALNELLDFLVKNQRCSLKWFVGEESFFHIFDFLDLSLSIIRYSTFKGKL